MIKEFRGKYRFLSNFWGSPFSYDGIRYPTNEHFYQAMKSYVPATRREIVKASTPGKAKRLGGSIRSIRGDWEKIKVKVMYVGLKLKFENPALAKKLKATFPKKLQEGNLWGDETWGVNLKTGAGQNLLGILLMQIRTELIHHKTHRKKPHG
ncbi:unnamed protein product [marine sediment metagenome]|uniref:NADAR domain-containing protein n=1 Tax=marine sediment metagenome TaxID=412755 RepID=X0WDB9_9ZZZZ